MAVLLAGCSAKEPPAPRTIGVLASDAILEASGLAASRVRSDRLWIINDGGSRPDLHAVGLDGSDYGRVSITNAQNIDWEDLASFELNGARHLLIADIGDNESKRQSVTLYLLPEPDPEETTAVEATRRIHFRYPDGPRDAEAIAVDGRAATAYVLTKRTLPPELYAIPLTFAERDAGPVTARLVGPVTSLPPPTDDDIANAPLRQDWHWQPTALDFAADGLSAVILTYRAAYRFRRASGDSWYDALRATPDVLPLGDVTDAESMCLAEGSVYVTTEGRKAPLLRIDP